MQKRQAGPWLHAWHDPVANVRAYTQCMRLADVVADGEFRLLIADAEKKLKVYKGTGLVSEHALLESPSALACFYSDNAKNATPSVAVAAGPYIYIYRNLRPYYKFTLPTVDIDPAESEVWTACKLGKLHIQQMISQLTDAREKGVSLSSRSLNLLALKAQLDQEAFVEANKQLPLVQMTVVTCMETLAKDSSSGDNPVTMLVVATESRHVLILDSQGTTVLKKILLPSVPVCMCVNGSYDVEYRIIVACRNGNIYTIKKGVLLGTVIELETQPVGMVVIEKNILVGCMDNIIHSFHFKGKKNYSIYLPEPITNISLLNLKRIRSTKAMLVAMANGEVRLYNKKTMVASIKCDSDIVTGMRCGPYGREEAALILVFKSGAMTIKMLQRQAKLDVASAPAGPPPEQDIPLNVPKKTKLYVEQTQRERDQAVDMHQIFQRDLVKLRLATARSYVRVITDGQGPISTVGGQQLRIDAKVQGLGPVFKIKISLKNTGNRPVSDLPVTFTFNPEIYSVRSQVSKVPLLLPGLTHQFDLDLECISPAGLAEPIRVFVCNPKSCLPILSAICKMPICEPWEQDGPR